MNPLLSEYAGKVIVSHGKNPKQLYAHQLEALNKLNALSTKEKFKGMLVFPTGGGKTFTAVSWVLRNVIDKEKKVLWIAHRHELLNQAKYTIQNSAYSDIVPNRKEFNYRVISGMHDKPVNIKMDDDFIIASKDSLNYGMEYLKNWIIKNRNNIVLIIDEAHHAPAKSYRKIINLLDTENNEWFQMLGLTATPLRTAENEQGILGEIFTDGIAYGIDLKTLISRKILADPIFEELNTKMDISSELTDKDVKSIQAFDSIPENIAIKIAKNKERNNMIVNHYIENREKYDQMLLFAIDIDHAITLSALFNQKEVGAEYIVSNIKDMYTKVTISNKENEDKIKRFKDGKINVLINVNILTEGIDLPKVQSVFLTRPTISTILMTQMVGRALRGVEAGGTEKAYIVSFIDNWNDKIAWVNPETLIAKGSGDIPETKHDKKKYITRLVSISLMEEFAKIMDETIDTSKLENTEFIERIPVGLYSFSTLIFSGDGEEYTKNCVIIVYDSFKQAYEDFINDLDVIFKEKNISEKEFLDDYELEYLCTFVRKEYFEGYYNPINYKDEDIKDVLRYYALKETKPVFLDFTDRKTYDLSETAKYIWDSDLSIKKQNEYLDSLWQDEKNFLRVFFGNNIKTFLNQIDIELHKLAHPENYINLIDKEPKSIGENIDITKLSIYEIMAKDISYWRILVNEVYNKAKDSEGYYHCALSGFKSKSKGQFQIDHVFPLSKGGLTVASNLQLLQRRVNALKGNKIDYIMETDKEVKGNPSKSYEQLEDVNKDMGLSNLSQCSESQSADETLTIMNSRNKENYEDALRWYDKSIDINSNDEDYYLKKAIELEKIEKQYEAIKIYNKIIRMDDTYVEAYFGKGRILEQQGKHDAAIKCYDKIIELQPNLEIAYTFKGDILNIKELYNKAAECFNKALKLNSEDKMAFLGRGISFQLLEGYESAIYNFEKAVEIDDKLVDAFFRMAYIYDRKRKYELALKYYDKVLEINDKEINAYNNKGYTLEKMKRFDEALEHYDKALEIDSNYKLTIRNKKGLLKKMKNKLKNKL